MRITRFAEAPTYNPPLHTGVQCKRLQGHEAGPTEKFWVGLSVYPPGSSADESTTGEETIYTVLDGELVLRSDGQTQTLRKLDSVHFKKGEVRAVKNESSADSTLLVSIAIPQTVK